MDLWVVVVAIKEDITDQTFKAVEGKDDRLVFSEVHIKFIIAPNHVGQTLGLLSFNKSTTLMKRILRSGNFSCKIEIAAKVSKLGSVLRLQRRHQAQRF